MSIGNIRQFTVSNSGAFDATVFTLAQPGIPYVLGEVKPGQQDVRFDLTHTPGLHNGMIVQARVMSQAGAQSTDHTLLTYASNSQNEVVYSVAGTATAPIISLQRLQPIR